VAAKRAQTDSSALSDKSYLRFSPVLSIPERMSTRICLALSFLFPVSVTQASYSGRASRQALKFDINNSADTANSTLFGFSHGPRENPLASIF
jgi:hypothetical protein